MKVEYNGSVTQCHKKLNEILKNCGFQPRNNTEFDNYRVDVTCDDLPGYGFEADGKGWHLFRRRDQERDAYIFSKFGVKILRISENLLDGRRDEEVKDLIVRFIDVNNT